MNKPPRWLQWAREIQALAQTGLHYSETDYHRDRYRRLLEIAAEITAEEGDLDLKEVSRTFLLQPGYATPKVDVRGAVVRDGKVLLVREKLDGRWCLPGGWADVGESPAETVTREVWEEAGIQVEPVRLLGVFDANRSGEPLSVFHAYKLVFLCRWTEGQPRAGDETLDVEFFAPDDLPPLSQERTHPRHLDEVFAQAADYNRPPYFE
jgi:ADP-ribose pyrophosphatase YjhB (NUDIX family)